MGHSKQRLGLFVPIEAVITQEALLKQGTKNSWTVRKQKNHFWLQIQNEILILL